MRQSYRLALTRSGILSFFFPFHTRFQVPVSSKPQLAESSESGERQHKQSEMLVSMHVIGRRPCKTLEHQFKGIQNPHCPLEISVKQTLRGNRKLGMIRHQRKIEALMEPMFQHRKSVKMKVPATFPSTIFHICLPE